jgi:hypothetical protein
MALAALFTTAALAMDPPPSLIENKSSHDLQIRISDDGVPVGVVKFYPADETTLDPGTKNAIQSKNQTYPLKAGESLKMVICGSPALKDALVAIFLSLEPLGCDTGFMSSNKSTSRMHFVHGEWQGKQIDIHTIATKAGISVPSNLYSFKPAEQISTKSNKNFKITANPQHYQKAKEGPLWIVE